MSLEISSPEPDAPSSTDVEPVVPSSQETDDVTADKDTASSDVTPPSHPDVAAFLSSVVNEFANDALTSAKSPDVTSPQDSDSGSEEEEAEKLEIVEEREEDEADGATSDSDVSTPDETDTQTVTSPAVTSAVTQSSPDEEDSDSDSDSSSSESDSSDTPLQIVEENTAPKDAHTKIDDEPVTSPVEAVSTEDQPNACDVTTQQSDDENNVSTQESNDTSPVTEKQEEVTSQEQCSETNEPSAVDAKQDDLVDVVTSSTSDDVTSETAAEVTTQNMDCQTEDDPVILALCEETGSGEGKEEADGDGGDSAFVDALSNPRDSFARDDDFSDADVDNRTHLRIDDDDVTTSGVTDNKQPITPDADTVNQNSVSLQSNGDVTVRTDDGEPVTSSSS